jgi:putative ABC transport system permease protein
MRHAFRSGIRALLTHPRSSALLVLPLALGIGANAAVFTVVNGVLLRPLPYPEPDRLVRLFESNDISPRMGVATPNFLDWQEQAGSFEAMALYQGGPDTVLGGTHPVVAGVWYVSRDFFHVLGVTPARGRVFRDEETVFGGAPAVVVSDTFWRRQLGAEPDLSRFTLRVGNWSCQVVGVLPAGLAFPERADVYLPRELLEDRSSRTAHNARAIARLRPGRALESAGAEMSAIAARLLAEHRGAIDAQDVVVVPLHEQMTERVRTALVLLQIVVLFVLLAACANVATGLLTRGTERRRELAIRAAIGASRGRLVRQLLVETLALAAVGGAAGLWLAVLTVRAFRSLDVDWLPRIGHLDVDLHVMLFTAGVTAGAALVAGLAPSLYGTRVDLREALAAEGRSSSPAAGASVRHVLVGVEVALALVLLLGSVLLVRSLGNLLDVDTGFDPRGVITAEVTLPGVAYGEPATARAFYDRVLARVSALPGVEATGVTSALPLTYSSANGGFRIESRPELSVADWQKGPVAGYRLASDAYFATLGIPLRRGRTFTFADGPGAPSVAIVNQALARQYFPDGDPIGERIQFHGMDRENPWLTIVGVVGDVRQASLDVPPAAEVFVPYGQLPYRTRYTMVLAVRASSGDAAALAGPVRTALRAVDPDVPVAIETMEARVRESVSDRRFTLFLVAAFTAIVFTLAVIGVFGVIAHAVMLRTREIGIRVALGAEPRAIVAMMMRGAAPGLLGGLAGGLVGAYALTRAIERFLFGVSPTDPLSFLLAAAALAATGALAAWLPARRATRVDPVAAMQGT